MRVPNLPNAVLRFAVKTYLDVRENPAYANGSIDSCDVNLLSSV